MRDTVTVVMYFKSNVPAIKAEANVHLRGSRMSVNIRESLLHDTEQSGFNFFVEPT